MRTKHVDIALAELGRKEIRSAEKEMPGLLRLRAEQGQAKPLAGARIAGTLHLTIQTAVLIETLQKLGAEVTWSGESPTREHDRAAEALARAGVPIFAWRCGSSDEPARCMGRQLTAFAGGKAANMILDDGGDLTHLVHERHAALFEGPDPIRGISEQTTTGVTRLVALHSAGKLKVPALNINDSATKTKFDNFHGCREALADGIKRATNIMFAGKTAVVCGFGDVGKGSAQSLRAFGARVIVTEIDPICALQAAMEGYEVKPLDAVAARGDIFVTATGCTDVITAEHMRRMKDEAILCNVGHQDGEIDMGWLLGSLEARREPVKPGVDHFVFPDGRRLVVLARGRLVNLCCADGNSSFAMSLSFSNQVLAQTALFRGEFPIGVHRLPRRLDEHVAALHLDKLGAELTVLTSAQADYLGVPIEGPFKPETYRY